MFAHLLFPFFFSALLLPVVGSVMYVCSFRDGGNALGKT